MPWRLRTFGVDVASSQSVALLTSPNSSHPKCVQNLCTRAQWVGSPEPCKISRRIYRTFLLCPALHNPTCAGINLGFTISAPTDPRGHPSPRMPDTQDHPSPRVLNS